MRTGGAFTYVQFLQTFGGYQVIRYNLVEWEFHKGKKCVIKERDVMQKWCQPGRPTITLGVPIVSYPDSCRIPYSQYGLLQVKDGYRGYYQQWMTVTIYPNISLLPVYRKNLGVKPDFTAFDAEYLLGDIFSCPYFETLLKRKEIAKLKHLLQYTQEFNKFWPSVKVALRHGYQPEHWPSYFDYLKMLSFLHYDMRSPRYVAPPDWREIHDRVMTQYGNRVEFMQRRKEENALLMRAREEEERLKRDAEGRKSFSARIAKYEGLCITDENLVIKPLMTIDEFKEEGEAMNHCVFRLSYYAKPDSLILSARKKDNGERVETIEVKLDKFVIYQSRGHNNQTTPFHEEIEGLVKNAMPQIRSMAKRKAVTASRS